MSTDPAPPPPDETDPPSQESPAGPPPATEPAAFGSHFDAADGVGDTAGETADRRRVINEGISMFGTSGVTYIGDNMSINNRGLEADYGAAGPPLVLVAVSRRAIAELAEVFVQPDGYHLAREPFDHGHRLLLLGSRAHWGTTTTAIRLLNEYADVHKLSFAGELANLQVEGLPKGIGLILDATVRRTLAGFGLPDLEALEDRLSAAGSRLVVIADADLAAEHGSRPVWRELSCPPPAFDVVLAHLRRRIGSANRATGLIERSGLTAELRGTPSDTFDVRRLVELASDLAQVDQGGGAIEDAVARFANRAAQAVEQWLDEEVTERGDRAMVLTLAVLNGMPYDAVSRWTIDLERRWAAEEPAGSAGATGPSRRSRRVRLAAARGRLTTATWRARYGPAELEIASFFDDSYPQRILHHYWHEHDYDRELLIDWLRAIGGDVEVRVATRAALAAGYLGTYAFDTVRRDLIVPWVDSGAGSARELAVAALAVPARHPDTAARVIRLVGDWSWRDGAAARMTAARALGTSIGTVLSGGPDATLTRLAKGADGRLATALGDSIAELVAQAELPRQAELLNLLDGWSSEGRRDRQLAGVLGFLEVAWTVSTTVGGRRWPTLLQLAELGRVEDASDLAGRVRSVIARLWGRALLAPGADNGVRIVLGSWADMAQRDPELRPAFVSLFAEAASTPRHAQLLSRHADRLRTRKPAAPDIARKLLDALNEGAARHA